MTSEEWTAARDPLEMVNAVADGLTDRKLRLLMVACCRRSAHLLPDPRCLDAVATAERFADGLCGEEDLKRAVAAAREAYKSARHREGHSQRSLLYNTGGAVGMACSQPGYMGSRYGSFAGRYRKGSYVVMRGVDAAAEAGAVAVAENADGHDRSAYEKALAVEQAEQCRLLREIVGDPFHPVRLDPAWLAWEHGIVGSLAESIYSERAFERLPILADALEEAGCDQADLLEHLRGPGLHVRRCFALDLLLGKE